MSGGGEGALGVCEEGADDQEKGKDRFHGFCILSVSDAGEGSGFLTSGWDWAAARVGWRANIAQYDP